MSIATFGRARAAVTREAAKAAAPATAPAPAAPAPAPAAPAPETHTTAVAVVESGIITEDTPDDAPRGLAAVPGLSGEWSSRDAAIPGIKICQRTSKDSEEHPDWVGQLVYDGSEAMGDTATIMVVGLRKYYVEDKEFGASELPLRFDSIEEARDSGLPFVDVVDADLFVRAENDAQYERCTLTDEKDVGYYPARMTFRSSALSSFVGVIIRDLAGWLRGSMENGFYQLRVVKKSNAKGTFFVPVAKATGERPSPDLLRQLRLALGR